MLHIRVNDALGKTLSIELRHKFYACVLFSR